MQTTTQPAAKKISRKAAAAARFSDTPIANLDPAEAGGPVVETAAPQDPAKTGLGLTKAKAATKRASRAKVVKGEAAELVLAPVAAAEPALPVVKKARGKKAAAPSAPFEPAVYKDAANHTAIAVSADEKMVELIPMDSAGMSVTRVSRDRFAHDYKVAMAEGAPYPVAKAARVYLTQTIAMDPKAKLLLETLAAAEADKPIASGELVALMSRYDAEDAERRIAEEQPVKAGKAPKAPKAAATPKAPREAKPLGHRMPAEATKVIAVGETKVEAKVQPGSFRAARHNLIVSMAGKTVADVLGASAIEGKRAIAFRDIQFAVQHGFIKLV